MKDRVKNIVIEEFNRVDAAFETFRNNLKVNNKIANCIELDLLENLVKEVINNYEKYQDSQQDLIKGKDEYIAKLCNDRAELKEHEKELIAEQNRLFDICKEQEKFIKMASNYVDDEMMNEQQKEFFKKVVEKYGKKEN